MYFLKSTLLFTLTLWAFRSKKETERLFRLHKTPYKRTEGEPQTVSEISMGEVDSSLSSNLDSSENELSETDESMDTDSVGVASISSDGSEHEQPYERQPRRTHDSQAEKISSNKTVSRLPIKLPDGQILPVGVRVSSIASETEDEEEETVKHHPITDAPRSNIAGARFGRAAVADIIRIASRKERIQVAREQIAGICQEILSEPENGVSPFSYRENFADKT
jgi:nucleolar complex protein 3